MSAFENASAFFHACESGQGWAGCQAYVADGAVFSAQCEPLTEIGTVHDYTEWLAGLGASALPDARYDLHASAWDDEQRTALFFGTFHATHTGDGGPVPATGKATSTEYVYALTMDDDDKVARMVKIWNAGWALRALGWM